MAIRRLTWLCVGVCLMALSYLSPASAQAECGAPPRLSAGGQGYVLPDSVIRLRNEPTTEAQLLAVLYGVTFFEVVDGYVCGEGYNWWQVQVGSTKGWAVEGDGSTYFVEPSDQAEGELVSANSLAFSPDNRWLAVGTNTGGLLFDISAIESDPRSIGRPANDLTFRSAEELVVATVLQDNDEFGFTSYDPATGILLQQDFTGWEGEVSPPPDPSYQSFEYAAESYAYIQDRWGVVVNGRQQLFLSQIEDGSRTVDVALLPDARNALVLYSTETGGRVGIHELRRPTMGDSLLTPLNISADATSIAVSADGSRFGIGTADGRVLVGEWAARNDLRESSVTEALIRSQRGDTDSTSFNTIEAGAIRHLALSPDGSTLAVAADNWLVIMNAETLDIINVLTDEPQPMDVAYSADGLWLAMITAQTLQVFDTVTYESVLFYTFGEQ